MDREPDPRENGRLECTPEIDRARECPYHEEVGFARPAWGARPIGCKMRRYSRLLPPRSMVGQLTLDQHIGVRIPGGQPIKSIAYRGNNILDRQ